MWWRKGNGELKKEIVSGITVLSVLTSLLTLAFMVHQARAATIIVPDNYKTIQQAVNAAVDGDTVLVRAGTYDEDILIDHKSISLIGEGSDKTAIVGQWYCIPG
jgi:pectin methylesterase-like acyl-CoA thioesterase